MSARLAAIAMAGSLALPSVSGAAYVPGRMRDLGPLAAATPVRIALFMRYRNESELRSLVRLQGMRASPVYHHYLSKAQWNASFAPSEDALERAALALRSGGFHLERPAGNRGILIAVAPARAVERFFGTELHRVVDQRYGAGYVNLRPAVIPLALRDVATAVAGLSSLPIASYPRGLHLVAQGGARRHRPRPTPTPLPTPSPSPVPTASPTPRPLTTDTPPPNPSPQPTLIDGPTYVHGTAGGYGPVAVAVAYDYPVMHGYDGLGRTAGNVVSNDFADADLAAELSEFGETRAGVTTRIPVDGGPGPSNAAAQLESTTDVEAIVGLSPGVNYDEYLIPALNELEIENAYNQVVSDDLVDVVNSSFGTCEADDPTAEYVEDELALQGAAKGITFVAATGDNGADGCPGSSGEGTVLGIETPAAAYHFVAVGATNPIVNPDTGAYLSEDGWEMSGGGVSVLESLPNWQAATPNVITSGRNTPDVSLLGGDETGYEINDMGGFAPESGTSVSSALFVSLIAQIDGVQGSRNGWITPRLYQIIDGQGYGFAFRDVVGGNNGMYTATTGYDNVTGIGSPLGWEMAAEL